MGTKICFVGCGLPYRLYRPRLAALLLSVSVHYKRLDKPHRLCIYANRPSEPYLSDGLIP